MHVITDFNAAIAKLRLVRVIDAGQMLVIFLKRNSTYPIIDYNLWVDIEYVSIEKILQNILHN